MAKKQASETPKGPSQKARLDFHEDQIGGLAQSVVGLASKVIELENRLAVLEQASAPRARRI